MFPSWRSARTRWRIRDAAAVLWISTFVGHVAAPSHVSAAPDSNAQANNPISFSTYFGGSASEAVTGVAVDVSGDIYVTGWTESADLPIHNAAQSGFGG